MIVSTLCLVTRVFVPPHNTVPPPAPVQDLRRRETAGVWCRRPRGVLYRYNYTVSLSLPHSKLWLLLRTCTCSWDNAIAIHIVMTWRPGPERQTATHTHTRESMIQIPSSINRSHEDPSTVYGFCSCPTGQFVTKIQHGDHVCSERSERNRDFW